MLREGATQLQGPSVLHRAVPEAINKMQSFGYQMARGHAGWLPWCLLMFRDLQV